MEVMDVDLVLRHGETVFIGLAMDRAAPDPSAGQPRGESPTVMTAARVGRVPNGADRRRRAATVIAADRAEIVRREIARVGRSRLAIVQGAIGAMIGAPIRARLAKLRDRHPRR